MIAFICAGTRSGCSRRLRVPISSRNCTTGRNSAWKGTSTRQNPWMPYHRLLTEQTAALVGAQPAEVVVMNSLTVNLHLMMVSFYRPTTERHKILVEARSFSLGSVCGEVANSLPRI